MNMTVERMESQGQENLELSVSYDELKKQSDRLKRFTRLDAKTHPQLSDIKNALKTLQPSQLNDVLKNTQHAISGNGDCIHVEKQDMPLLISPGNIGSVPLNASDAPGLSTAAEMTALLGKITQLTTDTSLQNMVSRLHSYNSMMLGAVSAYSSMADALENQGKQYASDLESVKEAQKQADALSQKVGNAKSGLEQANEKLRRLENEAAGHVPVPEKLQREIEAAKEDVERAQGEFIQATKNHNNYISKTLNPAIQAEQDSKASLIQKQEQSQKLIESFTPRQQGIIEQQRTQNDREIKSLTFLMALISQLINQSSSDDLKAIAELKQKLSAAAAKDAEKKALEYEAEVRKAEEMQNTMGCIGKVLGWLVTAVSFAAAVFTGGASLALAAVSLTLTIADEINQAVTGNSFMQAAMQPLMDAIVKPLMDIMAKMFSSILQGLGVDSETASMVGQIMGAVAAAVMLVAAVMLASSAASKLFDLAVKNISLDTAKSAAQASMKRMMDSTVGQAFKRISNGFGGSLGIDEIRMAKIANRTQMAMTGTSMLNTSIQTAGNIISSNMMVNAAKAKAALINNIALQELLNEMMSRAIDAYAHRMETVNAIVKNISIISENQLQAGKYINKQMRSVAG